MSTSELIRTIEELQTLEQLIREAEAEAESLKDSIKAVMGDEEILTAEAYKVSWKTFTSSRVDTTALKKALSEVAAVYAKTTIARHFSIN